MTHNFTFGWGSDSGAARGLNASKSITDTQELNTGPVVVNNGSTDQLVTQAFTAANVSALELLASVDMTLETNSGSSPGNTIALKAGIPFPWFTGCYWSNPFTVDVTAFYLTNASGQQGTFQSRILKH